MKLWNVAGLIGCAACALSSCFPARYSSASQSSGSDVPLAGFASQGHVREPHLVRLWFNPYTDSIKPVLNYYVNVEGQYSDGSYLPLDTTKMLLSCDRGTLSGNEWVIPKKIDFEKVTFTTVARENSLLRDTITLWIQRWKDPRDAMDYVEPEDTQKRK